VDRPDPSNSGGGPGGRQIVLGRALAVIVAAVVLGAVILQSGGHSPVVALGTSNLPLNGVTTTTTPRHPATSTSTTLSHAGVTVLVANSSTTGGVAAGYSTVLQHAGWTLLPPVTAKAPVHATSSVYYAANKRPDADVIAAALGIPDSAVFPVSAATPVTDTAGADVVLVIGSDLAAKTPPSTVPPSTVPPTTTTTTTTHKSTTTTTTHKSTTTTTTHKSSAG
jgi:hypothetical protein